MTRKALRNIAISRPGTERSLSPCLRMSSSRLATAWVRWLSSLLVDLHRIASRHSASQDSIVAGEIQDYTRDGFVREKDTALAYSPWAMQRRLLSATCSRFSSAPQLETLYSRRNRDHS